MIVVCLALAAVVAILVAAGRIFIAEPADEERERWIGIQSDDDIEYLFIEFTSFMLVIVLRKGNDRDAVDDE
jgi:hypothetical protein